jgi:hypothetical protein
MQVLIYRIKYILFGTRFLIKEINSLVSMFGQYDFSSMLEVSTKMKALQKVAGQKYVEIFKHAKGVEEGMKNG